MSNWHQQRLATFDLETTGVDCEKDEIVTAAITLVGGNMIREDYHWLINPGIEIPEESIAIHGISNQHATAEGVDAKFATEEIVQQLTLILKAGLPLIVYNAKFDITFLDRQARRYGVKPLTERVYSQEFNIVDPYVLDKHYREHYGKRRLVDLCQHYYVPLTETDAHDAQADALATARLSWRMGEKYPELASYDLNNLHSKQVEWAKEQAHELQAYFDRVGRDEKVNSAWPLEPFSG